MIESGSQDEVLGTEKDEVLQGEAPDAAQDPAPAWSSLQHGKFSRFRVAGFSFAGDRPPTEESAPARHRTVSQDRAAGGWLRERFHPLPETSGAPIAEASAIDSIEFEPLTGRPAWFSGRGSGESGDPSDLGDADLGAADLPDAGSADSLDSGSGEISDAAGGRLATRWFALKHFFHDDDHQEEVTRERPVEPRIPCMTVFSLAGGVGKTSLVATLGRALSAHGERVLLVETTSSGLLPFYFGARDGRPGVMRTFTAPGSTDAAVNMVGLDPDEPPPMWDRQPQLQADPATSLEPEDNDWLVEEISRHGRGSSRMLIDLSTASSSTTRRLLKLTPTVLVPVTPDVNSVVSLNAIESFFRKHGTVPRGTYAAKAIQPFYLINQFDPALPLHLDVREVMRQQLGDRLLPFTLRRNPVVSEAMAQGMTVIDYAPNSSVAEDYMTLAGWIRSIAAPATPGYRGVRWSERIERAV